MNDKIFAEIIETLNTNSRITYKYQFTPRTYGTEDLLYQNDVHVMQIIAENPCICLNDLAEKTYRTKSAMSLLIKPLVEKGIIETKRDEKDKRKYIINLTDKGKRINTFHLKLDNEKYCEILKNMNKLEEIKLKDLNSTLKVLTALNKELHNRLKDI